MLLEELKVPTGSRRVNEIITVGRKHIQDVGGGLVGENGRDIILTGVHDVS